MAQVTLEAIRNLLPAGCTITFAQTSSKAEQSKLLADADVVMIVGTFLEGDVIRQAPRLKMIQKWGIGVDKIDLVAAKECNVLVSIQMLGIGKSLVCSLTIPHNGLGWIFSYAVAVVVAVP